MTPADLVSAGSSLYGREWQRRLARELGPLHPRPREALDDRLIRRWVAGDAPVPEWVEGALQVLARREAPAARERFSIVMRMAGDAA